MDYSRQCTGTSGELRFTAYKWDIRSRERSAGIFASAIEADRAWQVAGSSIGKGHFADIHSGRQAFRCYVLQTWLPRHMVEAYTQQGCTQTMEWYLLPQFGRMRTNLLHALREFEQFYNTHRTYQGMANTRPRHPLPLRLRTCTDDVFGEHSVGQQRLRQQPQRLRTPLLYIAHR